ncbi:MAG: putative capsid protein [Cressdnaviricota sp.]|nr:MAG: putative capsid protein [Cressdnaviricota sp.]
MPASNIRKTTRKNFHRYRKGYQIQGRAHVSIPRTTLGPRAMALKLRYNIGLVAGEGIAFTSSAGGITNQIWTINNPYDLNASAGGHQPLGFDQYMAIYGLGVCVSAKCTFDWIFQSANPPTHESTVVYSYLSDQITAPTKPQILELPRRSYAILTGNGKHSRIRQVTKVDMKKFFNQSKIQGHTEYQFSDSVASFKKCYLHTGGYCVSTPLESSDFRLVGTIDCDVILYQLRRPAQSII